MVDVEEEIEMLSILEQTDMEQSVLVDVERHDQRLSIERRLFNSQFSILNFQFECLCIVDSLQWVALLIQLNAGEQRWVCGYCKFNGFPEFFLLQCAV